MQAYYGEKASQTRIFQYSIDRCSRRTSFYIDVTYITVNILSRARMDLNVATISLDHKELLKVDAKVDSIAIDNYLDELENTELLKDVRNLLFE